MGLKFGGIHLTNILVPLYAFCVIEPTPKAGQTCKNSCFSNASFLSSKSPPPHIMVR